LVGPHCPTFAASQLSQQPLIIEFSCEVRAHSGIVIVASSFRKIIENSMQVLLWMWKTRDIPGDFRRCREACWAMGTQNGK
jgi:hypothetical protein